MLLYKPSNLVASVKDFPTPRTNKVFIPVTIKNHAVSALRLAAKYHSPLVRAIDHCGPNRFRASSRAARL
jgi:hypothetical protein